MENSPQFGPAALPRSLGAALRDVKSRKLQVRRSATRELGSHVDSCARDRVVKLLEELAEQDADIEVRAQAVLALADGGALEATEKLVQLAGTAPGRVRQMALLALGELAQPNDQAVIDVATEAVQSELPALRYQALVTLRHVQCTGALETLALQLADSDDEVRWVAIRLIDELSIEEPNQPESSIAVDRTIQQVSIGLRTASQDTNVRIANAATLLLARRGDPRALSGLIDMLSGRMGKLDLHDELAAIRLIAQWRVLGARPILQKRAWPRLWQGATSYAARLALAELGDERAIQSILDDLNSGSHPKCARAIETVGSLGLVAGRARLMVLLDDPRGQDAEAIRLALQRLGES